MPVRSRRARGPTHGGLSSGRVSWRRGLRGHCTTCSPFSRSKWWPNGRDGDPARHAGGDDALQNPLRVVVLSLDAISANIMSEPVTQVLSSN